MYCGIIWGLHLYKFGVVPIFLGLSIFLIYKILAKSINIPHLKKSYIMVSISLIVFGMLYTSIRNDIYTNSYTDSEVSMQGEVKRFIATGNYYNKYILANQLDETFLLYIPKNIKIKENDIISINGQFQTPSVARNKGGFDYSRYLYSQGIIGSVYVYNEKQIEIIDHKFDLINYIRNKMLEIFGKLLPKEEMRNNAWHDNR